MRLGLFGRDIDWSQVGAELARDDDFKQVEFFKSFIKECLSWGTHHQVELQLASVNLKLTKEEKEVIAMLGYQEN